MWLKLNCELEAIDRRRVLIIVCCASFIMPFMNTMMNLALIPMGKEFAIGTYEQAISNMIFVLATVLAMIPISKLERIYGRNRMLMIGLILITISSLLAALSPNYILFLIMRFASGLGASAVAVISLPLIADSFPQEIRGKTIGIYTTFVYIAFTLGPFLGGLITENIGWRGVLLAPIPFAIISLILLSKAKVTECCPSTGKFSIFELFTYSLSMIFLIFGISSLPAIHGIGLVIIGIVCMIFFIRLMGSSKNPLLDLQIFKYKSFSRSCLATFLNYCSSYSVAFFLALYLQYAGELTPTEAGLILLIQPFIQVLLSSTVGRLSDKIEKRILTTLGMIFILIGTISMLFITVEPNLLLIIFIMIMMGLGIAFFASPNLNMVMSSIPGEFRSNASGIVSMSRQFGMTLSISIAMSMITLVSGSITSDPSTLTELVESLRYTFVIGAMLCIFGVIASWFRGTQEF